MVASPHHSPSPSPSTSDVMSSLCTMKSNQNGEISVNEKDNRSSQKHNSNSDNEDESRKRDEPEDESERKNEHSNTNNKKVRVSVSVASLPEPELGHALELEPPASFNTLDDDCLGNVLDFVGKKCYSAFGRVNKGCHEMFCSKGLPKETYFYGYGPLHLITQKGGLFSWFAKGVFQYNRRDILEMILADDRDVYGYERLKWLCKDAIEESRLDILREVFQRANERQLTKIRYSFHDIGLCATAAKHGKLEYLKFLRENKCYWNHLTWYHAKEKGHEHILQYLRDNGYPTEWQVDLESQSQSESEIESES